MAGCAIGGFMWESVFQGKALSPLFNRKGSLILASIATLVSYQTAPQYLPHLLKITMVALGMFASRQRVLRKRDNYLKSFFFFMNRTNSFQESISSMKSAEYLVLKNQLACKPHILVKLEKKYFFTLTSHTHLQSIK